MNKLEISKLSHTWIIDMDGTICVHNGYKSGSDVILPGVREFFSQIPEKDMIIILTSRSKELGNGLKTFMQDNNLRYDHVIFDAPMGERVLINDDKPSGLKTAYAISKKRDMPLEIELKVDEAL